MKRAAWTMGLAAAAGLLWCAEASAQTPPGNAGSGTAAVNLQSDFRPSMSDLMTLAIQPRHTKLGLAGRAKNWTYALYEINELRNAFARVGRTIPIYRTTDMTTFIGTLTAEPLIAVEQAIHARDSHQFAVAYAHLTDTCNACHRSQDHAAIVIRVPRSDPYPDQDFRPQSAR